MWTKIKGFARGVKEFTGLFVVAPEFLAMIIVFFVVVGLGLWEGAKFLYVLIFQEPSP